MKIVVVGKGGREHALVSVLANSPGRPELFCFPGSDAIAQVAKPVEAKDLTTLVEWMKSNSIDLCVAGEESYLIAGEGLKNSCQRVGIPCWGPTKEAAQLESSKEFAKKFMLRHNLPTGNYSAATTLAEAIAAIAEKFPAVLKFDGLAAGKGVAVCPDEKSAQDFLNEIFTEKKFGPGMVLVEEFLEGPEVSIFAAVSGEQYKILTPARDYKRIGEGDLGPNTGGMGAVASQQLIDQELLERIEREIVKPTVAGLLSEGMPYTGFLYFGLMLTKSGPKIIEYNCRFGDPECQAVMPLISGDLANFCYNGARGNFEPSLIKLNNGWSVAVVLASKGYPVSSCSGDEISGLDQLENSTALFHAGTRKNPAGKFETNGGRVLSVVATGTTRQQAVEKAHAEADKIVFSGMQRRRDIGICSFE